LNKLADRLFLNKEEGQNIPEYWHGCKGFRPRYDCQGNRHAAARFTLGCSSHFSSYLCSL